MTTKPGILVTLDELIESYMKAGWTRDDAELHHTTLKDEETVGRFNDCNDEI